MIAFLDMILIFKKEVTCNLYKIFSSFLLRRIKEIFAAIFKVSVLLGCGQISICCGGDKCLFLQQQPNCACNK